MGCITSRMTVCDTTTANLLKSNTINDVCFRNAALSDVLEYIANARNTPDMPWIYVSQKVRTGQVEYKYPILRYNDLTQIRDDAGEAPTNSTVYLLSKRRQLKVQLP